MNEKSDDLLFNLKQNKSINSTTIDSLIKYGFDSNKTLMALDFESDFPEMTDICLGQKSLLRKVLSQYKSNNDNEDNDTISDDNNNKLCENVAENNSILNNRNFFDAINHSIIDELKETVQKLEKIIVDKDSEIVNYKKNSNNLKLENQLLKMKLKKFENQTLTQKCYLKQNNSTVGQKCGLISSQKSSVLENEILKNCDPNSGEISSHNLSKSLVKTSSDKKVDESVSQDSNSLMKNSDRNTVNNTRDVFNKNLDKTSSDKKLSSSNDSKCKVSKDMSLGNEILKTNGQNSSVHSNQNTDKTITKDESDVSHVSESVEDMESEFELNFSENSSDETYSESKKKSSFGFRRYKCNYKDCKKSFCSIHGLKRHVSSVHKKEKAFECNFENCTKTFRDSWLLKQHMNRHLDLKPFKCDYNECHRCFVNINHLRRHLITHTKERPFKCHYIECQKSYGRKDYLKDHIKRHHKNENSYECSFDGCKRLFNNKSNLNVHMNRHLGVKKFKCDYNDCGLSFVEMSQLRRHVRSVHTKEKPFKCDYNECGLTFSRVDQLKSHSKRHQY